MGNDDIIVGGSAPPLAHASGRGLTRATLPVTRRLEPRELIDVDIDEQMDEAAAIEAASAPRESAWAKTGRVTIVGLTGIVAWCLLPATRVARPPIELPAAVQKDDVSLTPQQRKQEEAALRAFKETGPNAAVGMLQACVESGTPSHSLWATYLAVLDRLDRNPELLHNALAYSERYPDRLEGAHFVAEGLVTQPLHSLRVRDGFLGSKVADQHVDQLVTAQERVRQALALIDQSESNWPRKICEEWRDCLRFDAARLWERRWHCRDAKFDDDFRDNALAELDALASQDAVNALGLRLAIYERLYESWPGWFTNGGKKTIGRQEYTRESLKTELVNLKKRIADAGH